MLDLVARETAQRGQPLPVLDLGSGDGRISGEIARTGAAVTGVDPSEVALTLARRAHPQLEFVAPIEGGRLPFEDGSFDAVVCVDVLQHVPDTQTLMSEARRVLRPAGALALSVPWHGRLQGAVAALLAFERHHDPLEPVLRFYTARSLRSLLEDFGFDRIELRSAGGLPLARRTLLASARR